MENVNKQLLDAAKDILALHDNEVFVADPWSDSMEDLRQAIAAAEQAQQAEPVARDWPKLLEMARQIIRDGHVHDVGGGDLAVTTCEAFEGLDAFLKKNFPEPLGELTGQERKWLEAEAAIQPPFVPDGYALVPIKPTETMCLRGCEVSSAPDVPAEIWNAMLAAAQKGE